MKKLPLIPVIAILLVSCQKMNLKEELPQEDTIQSAQKNKKEFFVSDITEPYADRIYNTCLNEYVYLTGTVNYYIKESFSNGYYLDYLITLKADGIGEFSGIQFHGGGKSDGRVRQNEDGTDVKGKVFYNIKYSSPGGNHMGYFQHAIFILKNNAIRVDFNNETPTCE